MLHRSLGIGFPTFKPMSLSHTPIEDKRLVLVFAAWLFVSFGIRSFIDSSVWGNADQLLKQIDDAHCLNLGGETYSYEKRNKSTSHVHMMLATALAKMVDKIECVIFVNTPNSITPKQAINKTYSPWIFYELAMIGLIRRRQAEEHRPVIKEAQFSTKKAALDEMLIQYDADAAICRSSPKMISIIGKRTGRRKSSNQGILSTSYTSWSRSNLTTYSVFTNDKKLKHLEFVQNVITRMNTNSFLIKGWSVTLVAAIFALSAETPMSGVPSSPIFR